MSKANLARETESKIWESCTDAINVLHTQQNISYILVVCFE